MIINLSGNINNAITAQAQLRISFNLQLTVVMTKHTLSLIAMLTVVKVAKPKLWNILKVKKL